MLTVSGTVEVRCDRRPVPVEMHRTVVDVQIRRGLPRLVPDRDDETGTDQLCLHRCDAFRPVRPARVDRDAMADVKHPAQRIDSTGQPLELLVDERPVEINGDVHQDGRSWLQPGLRHLTTKPWLIRPHALFVQTQGSRRPASSGFFQPALVPPLTFTRIATVGLDGLVCERVELRLQVL